VRVERTLVAADYTIRAAGMADIDTLVAFTLREARDAEGAEIDPGAARRGVAEAFADPPRAMYWVAEARDGRVVASTSVVTEWSNFNGGYYWWVQSLFVESDHRSRGLAESLLNHLSAAAAAAGALDLRLYAYRSNERAIRAYVRCGFTTAPYVIMSRQLRGA
jgi:GNAT superfamily N-acetyltransferase